jgi:hypothetical protein
MRQGSFDVELIPEPLLAEQLTALNCEKAHRPWGWPLSQNPRILAMGICISNSSKLEIWTPCRPKPATQTLGYAAKRVLMRPLGLNAIIFYAFPHRRVWLTTRQASWALDPRCGPRISLTQTICERLKVPARRASFSLAPTWLSATGLMAEKGNFVQLKGACSVQHDLNPESAAER